MDHNWTERVAFDTTRSTLALKGQLTPRLTLAEAKRPPKPSATFDAFAEMAVYVRPCFRRPCFAGQVAERETPIGRRDD